MRIRRKHLGILLVTGLLTAPLGATSLAPTSAEDLTAKATLIVLGECTAVETRWVGRALYTLATVTVEETWKGAVEATVTVALPGGVDLNRPVPIDVRYPGAPQLAPGNEAVLFLTEDPTVTGAYAVVGFNAGAVPLTAAPTGDAVVMQRSVGTERLSIQALGQRVRQWVAEEGGAP